MFNTGAPQFGLRRAKIGTWDGDGTYSNIRNVPSVQVLSSSIETVTAQLEGDDRITATAAVAISGTVTLRMGSVDNRLLAVLAGSDHTSSGAGVNHFDVLLVTAKNFPYVGVVGQSRAAEGGGDTHLFIPKLKCTEGFEVRFEYGQFSIPEVTLSAVPDENFIDEDNDPVLFALIGHATATTDVTLPPTEVE
jgi:hypothetical protein